MTNITEFMTIDECMKIIEDKQNGLSLLTDEDMKLVYEKVGNGTFNKPLPPLPVDEEEEPKYDLKSIDFHSPTDLYYSELYMKYNKDNIKIICDKPFHYYIWDVKKLLWCNGSKAELQLHIADFLRMLYTKLNDITTLPIKNETETKKKKEITDKDLIYGCIKHLGMSKNINAICSFVIGNSKDVKFESELLNKSIYELPISNGRIINLQTLKITPRTKKHYFNTSLDVEYNPYYRKDEVVEFMMELMDNDKDKVLFLQKLFGYFMTGDISDRSIYIFHGEGLNGKSSLMKIFQSIMGSVFITSLKDDALMKKKNESSATPEIMALMTSRCSIMPESEKDEEFNSKRIKTFTGDDKIRGRHLYKDEVEFYTQSKIVLPTNWKPKIKNLDDKAFLDRLKLIPFNHRFKKDDEEGKAKVKKLQTYFLNDFFSYFCEGAQMFIKDKDLKPTKDMIMALNEYQNDNNYISDFINTYYIKITQDEYNSTHNSEKINNRIRKSTIYEKYSKLTNDPLTAREFHKECGKYLTELKTSGGVMFYMCKDMNKVVVNDVVETPSTLN
jgi:P4 family phage/plasmid primase-like protien